MLRSREKRSKLLRNLSRIYCTYFISEFHTKMPPIPGEHWKFYIRSEKKVNATFYRVWCKACILVRSESIRTGKPNEYGARILTAEEEIRLLEEGKCQIILNQIH